MPPVDPGLQPERTKLAWTRTALAFLANGGLMLHAGHAAGTWLLFVPGAVVMGCALVAYLVGQARFRQVETAVRAGEPVCGSVATRVTMILAVVAVVMAVVTTLARF